MPLRNSELKTKEVLRGVSLKATSPRLRILEILSGATTPLRIKEIATRANKTGSAIDIVTIYRTIEALRGKNLVRRVDFEEDAAFYEIRDDKNDHHHISCIVCHCHKSVARCFFSEFEKRLLAKTPDFVNVSHHSIEYFGMCKKCAAKAAKAPKAKPSKNTAKK